MRKNKRKFERLQKEDWHTKKSYLTLKKWYKNKNNHIKGFYKDNKGTIYTHWLSDEEIELLELESEVKI